MSQCVPSWDLEDINNNVFKLDNEVSELTWKNGQVAMQELDPRRVANGSQPTNSSWDKPRAVETLEAIVNQATHQPYNKIHVTDFNDNNLVPWLNVKPHNKPTKLMASDGLVPSTLDACCSTGIGSCSADVSGFMGRRGVPENDWNISVSESESGSGRDDSKSTLPDDDSACHRTFQWEANTCKEKKRGKVKSSTTTSNKRRRTAAIHNQSERKRRDKINQRINTLQKLVPNSNKTDKASMLDEVIDYIKQLQAQAHVVNRMPYISPMMLTSVMQQQQMQLFMMNSMGIGMGMGMGMGMDMNNIGLSNIPAFLPSAFMHMPTWNGHTTDRFINTTMATDPMSAFLACQSQPVMNMDSYSRMAALYQHMQNQPPAGPFHR